MYLRLQQVFDGLTWIVGGAVVSVILWQSWVYTQLVHFNEDIWARFWYDLSNFWRTATVSFFSPSYNLLLVSMKAFPLWGPGSHLPLFLLYASSLALMAYVLKKRLKFEGWLMWLGLGAFVSMPTLSESSYWVAGAHTLVSLFWWLLVLASWPQGPAQTRVRSWGFTGISLWFWLTSFPMSYPGYFLIILWMAWKMRRQPKFWGFWAALGLLGVWHLYQRNLLLNGSGWVFQPQGGYRLPAQHSLGISLEILIEVLEYSNPLIILQRVIPQGFLTLSQHSAWNLLHLFWLVPFWTWGLWRQRDCRLEASWIAGVGALLTLLATTPGLSPRYFPLLVFLQSLGLVVALQGLAPLWKIKRRTLMVGIALPIFGWNACAKITGEWNAWVIPKRLERDLLEIASQIPPTTKPLVFFLPEEAYRPRPEIFAGGSSATLGGLRRLLQYAQVSHCIYRGARAEDSPQTREAAWLDNDPQTLQIYGSRSEEWSCPGLPSQGEAQCWAVSPGRFRPHWESWRGEAFVEARLSGFQEAPFPKRKIWCL